jgi:hypothetical protein
MGVLGFWIGFPWIHCNPGLDEIPGCKIVGGLDIMRIIRFCFSMREEAAMKSLLIFLFILSIGPSVHGAEWYEILPPGITRVEILQIAGRPSTSRDETKSYYGQEGRTDYLAQVDRYELKEGYVDLAYDGEILTDCTHYLHPEQHQATHYKYFREMLPPDQIQLRRNYLNARQFALLPGFRLRHFVRTRKYPGSECYPIDHSFLILSPMLFGGEMGFFADKTAKVVLLDDKRTETVLYRAIDNWKNLRPPQVDDGKLKERAAIVAELKEKYPDRNFNIVKILGLPDSGFGSGIPYVAYYLEDGLLVGVDMKAQMRDITISRPGE